MLCPPPRWTVGRRGEMPELGAEKGGIFGVREVSGSPQCWKRGRGSRSRTRGFLESRGGLGSRGKVTAWAGCCPLEIGRTPGRGFPALLCRRQ